MLVKTGISVIFIIWFPVAIYSQANQTNGTTASVPLGTSVSPVPTPSPSDNTSTTPEPRPALCTPGNSVGYMIIRQPNISSMVTVGTQYNVSWDWSIMVTKLPSYVDVYVQLIANGMDVTWKNQVAKQVPVNPRWFYWKPDGLADGKYKIRLVPDGKETYNVPANQQPCFSNGEAIPSVSAAFTVTNSKGDLSSYPDHYPPNGAVRSKGRPFRGMLLLYALVVWCLVDGELFPSMEIFYQRKVDGSKA